MLTNVIRVAALWACLLPAAARAQAPAVAAVALSPAPAEPRTLAGRWQGPLSIPGGSVPVEIGITQQGADKYMAILDLPAKRLSRVPAALSFRGDTLLLYAVTVECRFVGVQSPDGRELRGIWSQPGLRVPLTMARFVPGATVAVSSTKAMAAKATTYHTEPVTLTSLPSKNKLTGTLSIPDGPGPFPAAVLLSDMGSQDRDARQGDYRLFATLAATLARQGVAVLRLDDRGVGESEGVGSQTTTAELVRDARAGLEFLRRRASIDATQTGLIGHGEGGNVALLAAAQPEPPAFIVTLAASGLVGLDLLANQPEPITSAADTALAGAARRQQWAEVLAKAAKLRTSGSNAAQVETYVSQQRLKIRNEERKQLAGMLKFRHTMFEIVRQTTNDDQAQAIVVNMLRQRYPGQDPALARARAVQLITPWQRHYLKFDPQLSLGDVQCPVLLLNGTDDAEVNATTNLAALEKGLKGNKRVTVRRLPGVNHWFQTPAGELLAEAGSKPDLLVSAVMLDAVRDWVLLLGNK